MSTPDNHGENIGPLNDPFTWNATVCYVPRRRCTNRNVVPYTVWLLWACKKAMQRAQRCSLCRAGAYCSVEAGPVALQESLQTRADFLVGPLHPFETSVR